MCATDDTTETFAPDREQLFSDDPGEASAGELAQSHRRLVLLYELSRQISAETDGSRVCDTILAAVSRLLTARHEAGHTILYWLSGWIPAYVTVVARGGHGGYMAPCAEEMERRGSRTRARWSAASA